jgi:hypothetical protein
METRLRFGSKTRPGGELGRCSLVWHRRMLAHEGVRTADGMQVAKTYTVVEGDEVFFE